MRRILAKGAYAQPNYPANPVQPSGGTGSGASFNIGISTPQFGHEAYPGQNFLLEGPGRLPYVVDSVTPFSLYSGAKASFAVSFNSPRLSANRNSTASRGRYRNIQTRGFTVAWAYMDQLVPLNFPELFGVSACNICWITTNGENAGENNVASEGVLTGSDLLIALDSASAKFLNCSMDYPRQALYRLNGTNSVLTLNKCSESSRSARRSGRSCSRSIRAPGRYDHAERGRVDPRLRPARTEPGHDDSS